MSAENNMSDPGTIDDQFAEHEAEHIVSPKAYVAVFVTLLALTFITYEVALINLGSWNIVAALGIAFIKSTLVALVFMHVYQSPRRTKLVVVAALLWLFFLIFLTMTDYMTRHWLY
jgi:cytochrome c oxidase subunit IV